MLDARLLEVLESPENTEKMECPEWPEYAEAKEALEAQLFHRRRAKPVLRRRWSKSLSRIVG